VKKCLQVIENKEANFSLFLGRAQRAKIFGVVLAGAGKVKRANSRNETGRFGDLGHTRRRQGPLAVDAAEQKSEFMKQSTTFIPKCQ
jgi:hypothetical protein